MNKLFGIALMALVFASCQNSDNAETSTSDTTSTTTLTTLAAPGADSGTQSIITTTPAAPATIAPTNNAGTAGLNPAHGAPGHRCDIAVGAPLNSPAGNTPAPAITTTPAPTMSQTPPPFPAPPANKNAKLNPAHGEPGHDCSVAVGAPLKS